MKRKEKPAKPASRGTVLRMELAHDCNRAVVVAVIAIRVVKVAVDQIIDVIAVRHGFVAAIGTVDMPFGVAANLVMSNSARGPDRT